MLLARPALPAYGVSLTPAWIAFALAAAWYLTRGNLAARRRRQRRGRPSSSSCGHEVPGGSVGVWLGWGTGFFAVGWLIQFVGHWYEGRKPAFVDDVIGLLVGPMFVTAEAMFMLGWNKPLLAEIERRAGPTHLRDIARIA